MRDSHANAEVAVDLEDLKAQLADERRWRLAAERALKQTSKELATAQDELKHLSAGSISILADVLAMALPEFFQKAATVQRWARRLAPHIEHCRKGELDLAAMLYPIGMLSLPATIAEKKAEGRDLTAAEQEMVGESAIAAHNLLLHIPHMAPVAQAILYSSKGYDGSGFPGDAVKGKDIPHTARVLKVLIDLADESPGSDRSDELNAMAANSQLYDSEIFKAACQHLRKGVGEHDAEGEVLTLPPGVLRPKDIVKRDIFSDNDRLLLAAGSVLSEFTIHRLRALAHEKRIPGKIVVVRP